MSVASTGDVEQANDRARAFVPGFDRPGSREQIDLALFATEIVGRLLGERDIVVLPRADDEPSRSFFIDLPGFCQRQDVRRAIDGLGQFFLAFFHLAAKTNEYVMLDDRSFDGDRAKGSLINVRFHLPSPQFARNKSTEFDTCILPP